MPSSNDNPLVWHQVFWPRPLTEELAARVVKGWATDQRSPVVILEATATNGVVTYLLGSPRTDVSVVTEALLGLCPGVQLMPVERERPAIDVAARIKVSTRHRAVDSADLPGQARGVLAALARTRHGDEIRLQVMLGPRRIPLAVPNNSPSSMIRPWYEVAWYGNGEPIDGEKRAALRNKVHEPGFACTVRLGASALTPRRREILVLGLMAALRGSEAPGVQLRLTREPGSKISHGSQPWIWPLRLGVHEVLALSGWPISMLNRDDDLPGLPAAHPKPLPPSPGAAKTSRVLAQSSAPGSDQALGLPMRDQLYHLHAIGPTGVGKSTMLARLALADARAKRGLVVIDPKGDLVDDILARLPDDRRDDVVVLDPSDTSAVVGFNPLAGSFERRPEVAADGLLAVFHQLWADSWGPRTQDILHASLLTLTHRSDASLVMLPLLLTNPGFRQSLTQRAIREDPIALGSFWAWYEQLSDGERASVIAPVMNKLRAFLLRPSMRAVLGQVEPKFSVRQVFTERKILLVSLSKGLVGPEAASLLGSLVVAELWQATLERAAIPAAGRHPVHVVVDELQDYLRLPTNLADALAQARGLGVGFTLAHQHLGQLNGDMQAAILANARSRVCFKLPPSDAAVLAKGHPELGPEDLTALGKYEVYADLMQGGGSGRYVSGRTQPLDTPLRDPMKLRRYSSERFGRALSEVEAGFADLAGVADPDVEPTSGRRRNPGNGSSGGQQ